MKQFWIIFSFEFKSYLKNKVFVGITVFLLLAMAVLMFFPRVTALLGNKENQQDQENQNKSVMLVSPSDAWEDDSQAQLELIQQVFSGAFSTYEVQLLQESLETIEDKITAEQAQCAFVFDSMTSYTYYVNNLAMYDANTTIADEVLQQIYQQQAIIEQGVPQAELERIFQTQITHEVTSLGKDQAQNFMYTYIMVFALYMVILLYGQMVATNVASEKSSRAMELLVTSAKPNSMMFGKVLASCFAGLAQLLLVFGSSILFYQLNQDYWADNYMMASIFNMPPVLVVYMLIFFMLGFFIYAFMYGAVGSMASKVEDINTTSMPITLIFIVGFMVVVFAMTGGSVDSLPMVICSYLPFTSSVAMFARIAMSTVLVYEVIISIGLLIVSVLAIGFLSARIYRKGVLMYGTPPKLSTMFKKD